ncbi:paralemmin-1 isoform X8 [Seriola lalandi dorsalis]|uniref:paralemmin-1 isoform X8 n=1 Tax=Seriola lalandi dorsalis TaxID=1841481 RepID=UPI000C6F608E|nr:paralemmin-1 isoform X8 [Seriola lalandi dorsalis]
MNRAVLDLDSDMEVSQALCQEDRLQLIAEKRKWQTEIENKKRQLEDDRRALQHLKSKALRERWLLDGQEQDEVKRQLEQDEAKTRSLEDTINRLEQELVSLETGSVCQTITHTTVSSGSDKAVEIKGHSSREQERTALSGQVVQVVHEMNGEDGIHLLSSSEVEELIHKADEASMMSQTVATVTSLPTVEVQEEAMPESPPSKPARVAGEITGLEAKPGGEPSVAKASAENPVTMVFMGYQSVEDEAETKKVLGLQGTVTAELVLIDDANGKTSPEGGGKEEASSTAQTAALPPPASPDPPPTTKPPVAIPASNGETAGEVAGEVERGAVEVKKEKQLCKCCSIM